MGTLETDIRIILFPRSTALAALHALGGDPHLMTTREFAVLDTNHWWYSPIRRRSCVAEHRASANEGRNNSGEKLTA